MNVLSYFTSYTNYKYMNTPNIFNFFTVVYDMLADEKKKDFVRMLKLHIGLQCYDQYRQYLVRKAPHHPILRL